MKYVKYNLKWEGPIGHQPYQKIADYGAELDGGVYVIGLDYYGYILGTDEQIANAIAGATDFNIVEILQIEFVDTFTNELLSQPISNENPMMESINYDTPTWSITLDGNGKLTYQIVEGNPDV